MGPSRRGIYHQVWILCTSSILREDGGSGSCLAPQAKWDVYVQHSVRLANLRGNSRVSIIRLPCNGNNWEFIRSRLIVSVPFSLGQVQVTL